MILGTGIDLLEVDRVRRELRRGGERFKRTAFTGGEIAYCDGKRYPARHFAARFAAKEAVLKALGMGGLDLSVFRQVEIRRDAAGRPGVRLTGRVGRYARERGVRSVALSLTHTRTMAAAAIVVEDGTASRGKRGGKGP
jgi:holo-[acyl-carrier protein] synthase